MPIGEILGELIIRPLVEVVVLGLFYGIGWGALKLLSLGRLKLAPFGTLGDKNRSKKRWYQIEWTIWLHRPMRGRTIRADFTCLVGLIVTAAIGLIIWAVLNR